MNPMLLSTSQLKSYIFGFNKVQSKYNRFHKRNMKTIDLRSDTVTKPTQPLRQIMAQAEVGDDVYGDDPSVNELQEYCAKLLGFEKALFTCSGTQANFVALLAHCDRGDEYIVGQQAHTYRYEGGGAAVFGSIQPQPIEFSDDGTLDLALVEAKIKPDDFHFAKTRLLCLENSQNGRALPFDYLKDVSSFAKKHSLRLHLDGARLFNSAVKQGVAPLEIAQYFDSVSICLSKGLGAPVGSVLCGSTQMIKEATRWRKVAGGGMRQAGILAAAGKYVLQNHVDRLQEDHQHANQLASGLAPLNNLSVKYEHNQTNMVFLSVDEQSLSPLEQHLKSHNIVVNPSPTMRLVTHLDINEDDVIRTIQAFTDFFHR